MTEVLRILALVSLTSITVAREDNTVQFLDEYGDHTSFLLKDGFIDPKCTHGYKIARAIESNMKILPISSIGSYTICLIDAHDTDFMMFDFLQDRTKQCEYGCATTCHVFSDTKPHRCPSFIIRRPPIRRFFEFYYVRNYWAYEYHAVCKENGDIHKRTLTYTGINANLTTGSLCDLIYTAGQLPITLTTAEDCTGKFKLTDKATDKTIYVSQTLFASKPKLILASDQTSFDYSINIYDVANSSGTKSDPVSSSTTLNDIDMDALAVRQKPYKVIITTPKAKHWFYLKTFDAIKFTLRKISLGNGKAKVVCILDADNSYDDVLEAAQVELFTVTPDGAYDTKLPSDEVTTEVPGRYKCKLKVKTKKVCFPYLQEVSELELGYKETKVELKDLYVTTTTILTTSTTTTTTEIRPATTTDSDRIDVTQSDTPPTTTTTKTTTESEETTETATTLGLPSPPDFVIKIYLSEAITNTSEDLTQISKLLIENKCKDVSIESGCSSCKFKVGRLTTGEEPYILIDVTGFAKRQKKSLTIDQLKNEFNSNFNGDSMVEQKKDNPTDARKTVDGKMKSGEWIAVIMSSTIGSIFLITVTTMGYKWLNEECDDQIDNDQVEQVDSNQNDIIQSATDDNEKDQVNQSD